MSIRWKLIEEDNLNVAPPQTIFVDKHYVT